MHLHIIPIWDETNFDAHNIIIIIAIANMFKCLAIHWLAMIIYTYNMVNNACHIHKISGQLLQGIDITLLSCLFQLALFCLHAVTLYIL